MNNLTFNNGAYKLEKANGEVYEGVVSNLVAHFLTDTITITDRVTLVKLPIITAQSNDLQIGGQTKTFEQIKTIIETELAKGGGASSADAVSYDNTTSGLQSTNVQDALDEVEANLGGFSIKILNLAPTDTTFANFVVIDQQQIQDIINSANNNDKFLILFNLVMSEDMRITWKCFSQMQGYFIDENDIHLLSYVEFDGYPLMGIEGYKAKVLLVINLTTGLHNIYIEPTRLMLTQEEYDAMSYHNINCEYLIK